MRIIDLHTHVYPDAIALKASASIGAFYDIPMVHDGTLAGLMEVGDAAGVDAHVIHSVATKPSQIESIHQFLHGIVAAHPGKFYAFGAMHPACENPSDVVSQAIDLGFLGIKLHPDIQGFAVDDPQAFPMYEAIQGRLPVLIHAGDNRHYLSDPERIASVMDRFPGITFICAHLGGWSQWEKAQEHLLGRDLYVDTSSSLYALTPARAAQMIRAFGAERVLYGTDYPMWDGVEEIARFRALDLTPQEQALILHQNAQRLLGI